MRHRRGSQLVEFALVLVPLLILVVNGLEIGIVVTRFTQIDQAARVGARLAAQYGGDDPAVRSGISGQLAVLGITDVTFCNASCEPAAVGAASAAIPAGPVAYGTQFTVTVKYRSAVNILWVYSWDRTKAASAVQVSERY